MKVFVFGNAKMIESGVGRAIYHQKKAAAFNDIELVDNLKDADVVHINTIFPKSYELAKEAHKLGKKLSTTHTLQDRISEIPTSVLILLTDFLLGG